MSTSGSFLTLSCPNCGGKLDIYPDMDRFGCKYCGTEILALRRGGTVGLKAVAEAIQKVQAGTDKTAAELALVRLEKERRELRAQMAALSSAHDRRVGRSALAGILGVVIGAIILSQGEEGPVLFGSLLLAAGVFGLWKAFGRKPPEELADLKRRIAALESKIADQRVIVGDSQTTS